MHILELKIIPVVRSESTFWQRKRGNYRKKYNDLKPKYAKILTDSQSALFSLNNIDFKSSIALKTAKALENIAWQAKNAHLPGLNHT